MKNNDFLVSDAILDFLLKTGIKKVFVLTGGAIAFVIDSFTKNKKIDYVCVKHEQAAAMMADAYSRVGPGFAATMSTSGPGATNLITGIACSYFDSVPNIHITGQVNTYEQKGSMKGTSKSRQIGFQETDIISISKPITKMSYQLKKASEIHNILEKLYKISQEGRQGPVLLDVPMDHQRVNIKRRPLFSKTKNNFSTFNIKIINNLKNKIKKIITLIKNSKRPVIVSGGGIRYSKSVSDLNNLMSYLKIPFVTTWSGIDTIGYNNKYYIGHIGVYGSRSANFSAQNSDLLISLGSRLDTRITGGRPETFARKSKVIMIDIDKGELSKRRGFTPYMEIAYDVKIFLELLNKELKKIKLKNNLEQTEWLKKCLLWKKKYPTVSKNFSSSNKFVNPYLFVNELSKQLRNNDIIIPDTGAHLTWFMQAFKVKLGQRIFSSFGNSPMGYSFPASIGASIALNKKRVICIDGDESFQINIQELQTLVHENLPIKIFIFNNNGYGIIKQFQELYLNKRYEATGKGLSTPNYKKIAQAYNVKYKKIINNHQCKKVINESLKYRGPVIIDISIHPNQKIIPKLTFGKPIEDLAPLIDRDEFNKNMTVKTIKSKAITEAN